MSSKKTVRIERKSFLEKFNEYQEKAYEATMLALEDSTHTESAKLAMAAVRTQVQAGNFVVRLAKFGANPTELLGLPAPKPVELNSNPMNCSNAL